MKMKWVFFLIRFIGIFMIILATNSALVAKADSVHLNETEGSVGFCGIYESESEPKPEPPNGETPKPTIPKEIDQGHNKGLLPQMGQIFSLKWIWLGISLIALILIRWKKKQRNTTNRIGFYMY